MKQKELYLVSFPFSDLSGSKVRPVLVVSNDTFNEKFRDVLVCAVTSVDSQFCSAITSKDMVEGTLHKQCYVKAASLLKIQKNLLLKRIGLVSDSLNSKVRSNVVKLL